MNKRTVCTAQMLHNTNCIKLNNICHGVDLVVPYATRGNALDDTSLPKCVMDDMRTRRCLSNMFKEPEDAMFDFEVRGGR